MQKLIVSGGNKLYGKVNISPAKNACLPIISSCVLLSGSVRITPCPLIKDVIVMAEIIKDLGGNYTFEDGDLLLDCSNINKYEGNCNTFKRARASFFTAGAILSRFNRAIVPLPGGCNLGERPIDIHLDVFKQLGVKCNVNNNCVTLDGSSLKSGKIYLRYPSVGATVNAINASVFLRGETVISNCAKEPEIKDLCDFLNACGFNVKGGGTSVISVTGVGEKNVKKHVVFSPIYDRIEAGTFMIAVCACGGGLQFECNNLEPLKKLCEILKNMGANVNFNRGKITLERNKRLNSVNVVADVYPAFPTDLQPQICALACTCWGNSSLTDKVFPERFKYIEQLALMGAKIKRYKNTVKIVGINKLYGANLIAQDLRGGAALVIGALCSDGDSVISGAGVLERGYENFDYKLKGLGAKLNYTCD